ncbi:phosphoserine phosphatase SerB [Vibrio sp. 10N.286.49.B3]|uniref:phosphoserine phosphatase n=1 Tax=Vibrio sp. 10N.286.49.B3 TaxID=1880855 RepID=UPI000C86667F|nr:phosphoserine phosphatase [Vibrio sp. 10N.286.49.B3]PMH41175.1 phosphoserine phosphatase SerB [Vibrio sp. 10N.286.49.B3]
MDVLQALPIKKHTSLQKRLPEVIAVSPLVRSKGSWIVFSEYLDPQYFDQMDLSVNKNSQILDVWKVGYYEVALMAGELTAAHEQFLQSIKLDYASLSEVPDLSRPGLIVMDMDSTAIQIECIDEIAKLAGVGEMVANITEKAMQGELDFEQSLRQRVGALKGADASILEQVRSGLPFMPDLEELVNTLKSLGWKTAIASGGFTYFSDYLQDTLDLDFAQSNQLEIIDGKLTGKLIGDVVSAQTKADILVELADKYEIEVHNTLAVGDGANDLVMMTTAGLGIAYHAKPAVEHAAQAAVRFSGLGGVLCILSGVLAQQKKVSWQPKP